MPEWYKLDNPVWYALDETHKHLGVSYENLKFYHEDYCIFGSIFNKDLPYSGVDDYAQRNKEFYLVGSQPSLPDHLEIKKELICDQMVYKYDSPSFLEFEKQLILLQHTHFDRLIELVNLVQPGFFRLKTPLMGKFYGIFDQGRLVAAAGCRMQMDHFVEISSIVTHPDFLRRNYAFMLTSKCIEDIHNSGKIAYLHVLETNSGAISLYKKCGFEFRRKMKFWRIGKRG